MLALRRAVARAGRRCMSTAEERFPPYVLNAPATEVSTLSNGVRVATEGGFGETATVAVHIDAGSRYEDARTNGAAHFLEHLIFKGTSSMTQESMEVEVENIGGHLNAYTSREQTVYYAKVFKKDVGRAVEILSDIVQNAKLDSAAIERERGVILREAAEVDKIAEEVVMDKLHETAFPTSGLGRPILGSRENIKSLSKADLQKYVQTHYTGPRVVVAGAGAVDHASLEKLVEKHFSGLPGASNAPAGALLHRPSDPAPFVGSDLRMRDDAFPVGHVAVAFETGGWTDGHAIPLMVMQQMLGQWDRTSGAGADMASFLVRPLAEQNLAHSVSAFNTTYNDTGLFGVYFVAEPTSLWDASHYVMTAFQRLTTDAVSSEEVARARQQLKTSLLMHLDGSTVVAEDIGRQLLSYGRRITPAEIFARIDAVDVNAVRKAADAVILDKDVALAALGHIHELPDYNWYRRRTSTLI